jgi:hypothetical protein
MDEETFQAALLRFRKVRSKDSELGRPRVRQASRSSAAAAPKRLPAPSAAAAAGSAGSAAAAAAAPPKDFWAGLQAFLEARYGAAAAKAISCAFDELHYSSLRSLAYEDLEDITNLIAQEAGLLAEAAPASSPAV